MHYRRIQLDNPIFIWQSTEAHAGFVWIVLDDGRRRDARIQPARPVHKQFIRTLCRPQTVPRRNNFHPVFSKPRDRTDA
jgi:hypothetical protein